MRRYWISWYQPVGDYRPLTYPPNAAVLGWWKTGEDCEDRNVLCALIESATAESAVRAIAQDWPDMGDIRFCEEREPSYAVQNDRFPLQDWMRPRMTALGAKG